MIPAFVALALKQHPIPELEARLAIEQANHRSPKWSATRKAHLAMHPTCAACGSKDNLEVHHCVPFHVAPELELAESNLITLCEGGPINCHFLFGHLRNWTAWNTRVEIEAADWLRATLAAKVGGGLFVGFRPEVRHDDDLEGQGPR